MILIMYFAVENLLSIVYMSKGTPASTHTQAGLAMGYLYFRLGLR